MKEFDSAMVSVKFARYFTLSVILMGLVVLVGWFSGLMFLTRVSAHEVPMAPSTAYVFIGLALGLWFYLRSQKLAINRKATILSAIVVICFSCLIIITNIFEYYSNWEPRIQTTSATLLKVFLPTTIAITVIESLIVIRILPLFNIHPAVGVSLVSLIVVAAVIIVIFIISKSMGKSLDTAVKNLSESEEKHRLLAENVEAILWEFTIPKYKWRYVSPQV
jgi:hypothetical protein